MPLDYFALSYLLSGPRKKLVEDGIQIINPVTLHSLCVRTEEQENRGGRGGGLINWGNAATKLNAEQEP